MARRNPDQLGIRFSTTVNQDGYEWVHTDMETPRKERLAPTGVYVWEGQNRLAIKASHGLALTSFGQLEVQQAMSHFKRLGDQLRPLEARLHEAVINGLPLNQIEEEVRLLKVSIQEFASQYGTLLGDHRPQTIDEWRKELRYFRDLWDIAAAIRTGDFRMTEKQLIEDEAGLWYRTAFANHWIVRREDYERIKSQEQEKWAKVYAYEEAMKGPRHRALLVFSKLLNKKLEAGFSMKVGYLDGSTPIITPDSLQQALYAKLLIKTQKFEQEIRGVNCLNCDQPISGTRRKKFCDDQCRAKYHNRKRSSEMHTLND